MTTYIGFRSGISEKTVVISASEMKQINPSVTDGVFWLNPTGTQAFKAYIDFTTPNGPWVHVGTAVGNTRGLYTKSTTWASDTTVVGDITNPYVTTSSTFNANSFIQCKGNQIMVKYSTTGYVQASGFNNESWRDVYSFIGTTLTAWPTVPYYNRALTITTRYGSVNAYNTIGPGLLYGIGPTTGNHDYWYVYCIDTNGDTRGYLTTGTYAGGTWYGSEADHGIGAVEAGWSGTFPGDSYANASDSFDAGTNDATDSGSYTVYNNIPFSMWIKN